MIEYISEKLSKLSIVKIRSGWKTEPSGGKLDGELTGTLVVGSYLTKYVS